MGSANSLRGLTLHQAIKNKMAPNCDWKRWEVRIMFSTDSYEEGRRKVKEAKTWSDLQSDAEMSGQKPPRWKMYGYLFIMKSVGIGPPGGCLLDSEEESGQLLPPAPTVNLPAIIPNNTFPPVPTTILPTANTDVYRDAAKLPCECIPLLSV
ncbi:Anoctamin-8 [Labeo rohita]|uniref:Anoctamin-8 n=1 Tax=Labeo rohita TaxID=84645 RepID=A0ABQ8L3I6_LABRO|nr:Anoctamin-8 [Labeo rohita]